MKNAPSGALVKLSDIARVQSGVGFPEKFQGGRDLEFPFYKVSDMNLTGNETEMISETNSISDKTRQQLGAAIFPPGSVIFPKVGGAIATNKKRLIVRPACVDNNIMGVIPAPTKISSRLLFYFFQAHDLSEFANNAGLPSIKKTTVENWILSTLPTLDEQHRLVGLLDEALAGLGTAQAHAEKNLQNARALFESHLQSAFTQRGVGWEERRLGDVVTRLTNGYVGPTRNIYQESGVPYLLARHVRNNRLSFDGKTFISEDFNRKNKKSMLKTGDVLLVQSGHIGHAAVVTQEHEGHNCHAMIVMTPVKEVVISPFLSLFFLSSGMKQRFEEIRSGSTVPHLTCGAVKELTIALPDVPIQRRLVGYLEEIQTETQRLEGFYRRKLRALDDLKKALLHQAFSGAL